MVLTGGASRPGPWLITCHHGYVPGTPSLTITEALSLLDPPITEAQLRHAIAAAGLKPCGSRPTGQPGRPHPTYSWPELVALHGALSPWLQKVS